MRTALTSSADALKREGVLFETLDFVYEKSRNFETLKKNLAAEVVKASEGCNLAYCVDGGVSEDGSASLLVRRKDVTVIEGVTKSGYCAAKAGIFGGVLAVSAYEIGERELSLPLVVYDIDGRELCSDVKLLLCELFGDEAQAYFLHGGTGRKIALYEADRQEGYDYSTMLAVYPQELLKKKRFSFEDFVRILRRLRAPDGCPWDRVQTHESIRINMIEEAYELVDAIDLKDEDKMCEEAGDVLMQAVFHTLIEEERGGFSVTDMLSGVCDKLIFRHTHVFGADKAQGADGALSVWDKNKMTEKGQATYSDSVCDVPSGFPALLRAQKICKRMAKGGWQFPEVQALTAQMQAQLTAIGAAKGTPQATTALGELLLNAALLARAVNADGEQALLDTAKRMQRLYCAFEGRVLADGLSVTELSGEQFKRYYDEAKRDVEAD